MSLPQSTPLLTAGTPVGSAQTAMLMLHGRGASGEDILSLADEFWIDGILYAAPQAAGNAWYPYRFLEPIEKNEPYLSSSLKRVDEAVTWLTTTGIALDHIVLLGFSQGACLALDYAARNARRYGGVIALSGGLIGPQVLPETYAGSFAGTPIFLGCSDVDPHIPLARVKASTEMLTKLGARVTERIYPGMGHTTNADEIEHVKQLLESVLGATH